MYYVAKSVSGDVHLAKENPAEGDDKFVIATSTKDKGYTKRSLELTKGSQVKSGELLPCVERAMIERGVLVEADKAQPASEKLTDIKGSKATEGKTQVTAEK